MALSGRLGVHVRQGLSLSEKISLDVFLEDVILDVFCVGFLHAVSRIAATIKFDCAQPALSKKAS